LPFIFFRPRDVALLRVLPLTVRRDSSRQACVCCLRVHHASRMPDERCFPCPDHGLALRSHKQAQIEVVSKVADVTMAEGGVPTVPEVGGVSVSLLNTHPTT
jgi:hypothetical protein